MLRRSMIRWVFFWASAQAMKLHVDLASNASRESRESREMTCEDSAPSFVKGLAKDLTKGYGYDSMFYKGCLAFVERNANLSIPVITQIENFGKVCKQGRFVKNETALGKVDPSRLAAECDRVVYNMDVQYRLLGGRSLSTPEGFCAVLIDMVLPIAEEPECMRFLEDIMHAHFEFLGTKHAWPTIIKEKHFDEAFITACLEDKKLSQESKGREAEFGTGSDDCKMMLEKLMAVDLSKDVKMPTFLADVCPLIGKPLPALSEPPKPTYVSTTRSLTASLFERAAHITHLRANSLSNSSNSSVAVVPKQKGFSALSLHLDEVDDAVSAKGGRRRRSRRRRLNHRQATCCDGKSRTYEIGVTAAAGVAIGTSAVGAEGYNGWSGDHCQYKWGQLQEVCGGVQLGAGIDVTVAHGYWYSYDNTKGRSNFVGASLCFFVCFGGEYVMDTRGREIGKVIETGGGFGGSISAGHCNAWTIWENHQWQHHLKGKCPGRRGGGCFPSDAQVTTPSGVKTMLIPRAT